MVAFNDTWQHPVMTVAGIILMITSYILLGAMLFIRPQPFTMHARINGGIPFAQWAFTNNANGEEIPHSQLEHYNRHQVIRWRDLRGTMLMAAVVTALLAAMLVGWSSGIL
jgi:hypothetical protein